MKFFITALSRSLILSNVTWPPLLLVMHLVLAPNLSHSSFFTSVTVQLCCDDTSLAVITISSTLISMPTMLNFLLLGFVKCLFLSFVNWLRTSVVCQINVSVQLREKPFESPHHERFGTQTTPSSTFCSFILEITFQARRGRCENRDVLAAIKNKSVLV